MTEGGTPGGFSTTVENVAVLERRERRLATQYRVTTILAESPSFREAAPAIIFIDELEQEARTVSRGRASRTPLMALATVAAGVWLVALVVGGIVALVMWLA